MPEDAAECVSLRGKTRENAVSAARLARLGITVESWAAEIQTRKLPGHVCTVGNLIVGYCFGDSSTGEIVVLALLPAYEGHGTGKALIAKVSNRLRSIGHTRLFLGCSRDPASRSYGFYRHLGWTSTEDFDSHGDEVLKRRFEDVAPHCA